jgi:hypothetical protein
MIMQLTTSAHDSALAANIAVLIFLVGGHVACRAFRGLLDVASDGRPDAMAKAHPVGALPAVIVCRHSCPICRAAGPLTAGNLEELFRTHTMPSPVIRDRRG